MADGTRQSSPVALAAGLRFGWSRQLPLFLQTEAAECGLACLAMVASFHGHEVDLAGLRGRFSASLRGMTLARMMAIAGELGFNSRPLRIDMEDFSKLTSPCILHWDLNHFVVLKRVTTGGLVIHDPARGIRRISLGEASEHFTGVVLELTPSMSFAPAKQEQKIPLSSLASSLRGVAPAIAQVLTLALALEVFALVSPFYLQWVLDQVLVSADHDLLTLLGLGFMGIAAFSALITAARSWAATWIGATLGVQWSSNLFNHLMSLPLGWYEKRHVGDVVSRFGSVQTIQKTLTNQFVGSFLDGLMSIVTLAVMCFYSVWLTVFVLGLFVAYGLARWARFSPVRTANQEQIICAAHQQSELLESIRGAMPIKLANKQHERLSRYTSANVATTNRDIAVQRLSIVFSLGNQLLFGIGRVALIWIAAKLTFDNQLSAGMLIAFVAYADQFSSRAAGLIDKWVDLRMLKIHGERIADIALAEPEDVAGPTYNEMPENASLELLNVSFRYAEDEPWILRNCSLHIAAGESIAIVGPSGCGKTTLAKIMLGLLDPVEGEVRFGGVDIHKLGLASYRSQIAAVMQDDQLFAGSIADNISFFDPDVDMQRVIFAAGLAAIHEDIRAMPMGYQSLVGDMGSSLSGGQRQRVIFARALYRQPRLIVLDEATSYLDEGRESEINASVSALMATRIVIAHRSSTIESADRVFDLGAKRVSSVN